MQPPLKVVTEGDRVAEALDASPGHSSLAVLQDAFRRQIVELVSGEITSKTMSQLQRFCASAGQALVCLEKPDALVRSRFRSGGVIGSIPQLGSYYPEDYSEDDALAPAPAIETYGANASRGIIESAAKIGKDIVKAQAEAQAAARAPTLTEMVTSLAVAKNAKVAPDIISAMEEQIRLKAAERNPAALPEAIPVAPPAPEGKTQKTRSKSR